MKQLLKLKSKTSVNTLQPKNNLKKNGEEKKTKVSNLHYLEKYAKQFGSNLKLF